MCVYIYIRFLVARFFIYSSRTWYLYPLQIKPPREEQKASAVIRAKFAREGKYYGKLYTILVYLLPDCFLSFLPYTVTIARFVYTKMYSYYFTWDKKKKKQRRILKLVYYIIIC